MNELTFHPDSVPLGLPGFADANYHDAPTPAGNH